MIYTLFFSRMRDLSPEGYAEYEERAAGLRDLAAAEYPGFVSIKTYVAADGERLTVARFEDEASQLAWRSDVTHREAQRRARTHYYDRFQIVICEEMRSHLWERPEPAAEEEEVRTG